MMSTPLVSVIVPSYNGALHLRECLASLVGQDYPHYEILLVDNGSTDETRDLCREFPGVRYLYYDQAKSSYAARNEGARHAKGEVLAFFDADQTARPNFLRLLLAEYTANDPYHVYVGRLQDDRRVPRVLREFFSWAEGAHNQQAGHIPCAAVALPKKLFVQLGGFKETMLSAGDFEFFRRAAKIAKVHVNPQIGADHYWARSVRQYLAKESRYQFGLSHLARVEGRRLPSCSKAAGRIVTVTCTKVLAAVLVPLRYPRREWPIRWQAQGISCLTAVYRFGGIARFKLGSRRAGDLPQDAGSTPSGQTEEPASDRPELSDDRGVSLPERPRAYSRPVKAPGKSLLEDNESGITRPV